MKLALAEGALVLVTALVASCAGGDETTRARVFTPNDAVRIVSVRPVTPGWPPWPQKPISNSEPDGSEVANKWTDDDKLANLVVQVFESATEAEEWLPEFNEFSRGVGEQTGSITKDEVVDDLGDEAWLLVVGGSGTQVTYHWRRGNLVFEAHVHCYGDCPLDDASAARVWADAIDEEARAS